MTYLQTETGNDRSAYKPFNKAWYLVPNLRILRIGEWSIARLQVRSTTATGDLLFGDSHFILQDSTNHFLFGLAPYLRVKPVSIGENESYF